MSQRSSKSPFDLISDDFFIDQILPRLDSAKSIVRLGLASKRFQSLCSCPSVLQFPMFTDDVGLIKYLDSFFHARMNKNSNMIIIKNEFRKLLLCLQNTTHIPILDFVTVHLLGWFHEALSLNVQELILQFEAGYDRYFVRPELNLQDSIMIPLKNLRVLTLDDIPITLNENFEDWISTYCVSLQELNLSGVVVLPSNLTITSSSLRVFTIDAHFRNLRVSAPKLVTLHVTWTRINLNGDESNICLEISDTSNVEDFLLANWDASYDSLIYGSSGDFNFPCLQSATLLLPIKASFSQTNDSLERLLLDISQTKELCISDTILHQISVRGIIHYATLFNMLDKFHLCIEGNQNSSWWKKAHKIIMPFVKKVPKLKTFKLTTQNGYYDPLVSAKFRESLVDNAYKLGISRPLIFLDDDKVKVVVSPGDDETLLLQHIINNAPRDLKFIFLYQS